MEPIADGVWQLRGLPRDMINVYLVDDVLIDAATRWSLSRILRQLGGRRLRMVALTHVHSDHQGVAAALCERFGVPLACHEDDVPVMEGKLPMRPDNRIIRMFGRLLAGPPRRGRRLPGRPYAGAHAGPCPVLPRGRPGRHRRRPAGQHSFHHAPARSARAAVVLLAGPGPESPLGADPGGPAAVGRLLRPRAAIARHETTGRLRGPVGQGF
jgi:hypothetical protein